MTIIKSILAIMLSAFLSLTTYSQNSSTKKFENAIDYLLANKEKLGSLWLALVNDNSARVFDYKKIIGSKMEFEISDTLSPRGILPFSDSLKADSHFLNITPKGVDSLIKLDEESLFNPHSDSLLDTILVEKNLKQLRDFRIVFSEPLKNTLRAELWYTYFGRGHRTRFGDSIMILFWFNIYSTIKKVYFIRAIK